MLRIDTQEVLPELPDVTIWRDDADQAMYYYLPMYPRFRLQNGKPMFKLIKYRLATQRPDGKLGGGFVFFDAELGVDAPKLQKLQALLQDRINKAHMAEHRSGTPPPVKFGTMTFTRGTVNMLLEKDDLLIERVRGAGKPSLFGNNVATFMVQLSPDGVNIFAGAMQGEGASMVSLVYDLNFWAKLPPIEARVWFNSEKFYSYYQKAETEVSFWSEDHYREDLHEMLRVSEAGGTELKFNFVLPDPEQDKKLKDKLRDWATRTLEDAITRQALQKLAPLSEDQRKVPQKVLDDLGGDDLDHLQRNITSLQLVDINYSYREDSATEWNLVPQGNLGTLTSIKGPDGKPLAWKDYYVELDGEDEFFKQLNVSMQVNADFTNLPLHSVELHLEYPKKDGKKDIFEERFTSPNDVKRYTTFIDNGNWKYKYWYEVNFKAAARTYKSPVIETDEQILTINVDQTGVISVDLLAGDLDFEQVRAAQVTMKYEDAEHNVPLTQQVFTIDEAHQSQRFQKVIFQEQAKPYEYRVKYIMRDGKEFQGEWIKEWTTPLIVNDPWSETKQIWVRASGNLSEVVDTIFLDLTYTDVLNKYTQTKSIALSENEPAIEVLIPVISGSAGKTVYSGMIKYRDGTEEPIAEQEATKPTIIVGPSVREHMEVTILPDLMWDDPDVRLVRVAVHYADIPNQVDLRKEFTFRPGTFDQISWIVDQKNKDKDDYEWQATFFMNGGIQRKIPLTTTTELTLVPELSQAV
jgi:hypothetical protein